MPDPATFDQALAELEALTPGEQRAVLARLDAEERQQLEGVRRGRAQPARSERDDLGNYSPWLRELIGRTRDADGSHGLASATRDALIELSSPPSTPRHRKADNVKPNQPAGASLLQVAGGLLRGRKVSP